jgi:cucumopine synthase-like protein
MQDSLEKLKVAREAIWLNEPADIVRLRTTKAARNQGASAVLYAAMKLGQLVTFLNHLRGVARKGGVDLGTMKAVTDPLLDFYAGNYCGFYRMTDTAEIVRLAKVALQGVKTLDEYVELTGELSLYVGRMDYWVDLQIPWAKFGEVYERMRQ